MLKKIIILLLFISFSSSFALSQEEEYYGKDANKWNPIEHFLLNAGIGGLSAGFWGYTAAYSQYSTTDDNSLNDARDLYLGIGMLAGISGGVVVTLMEQNHNEAFTFSKRLWVYGWYGAIFGGLTGAAVGFIPNSSSVHKDDNEDIKRFAGYGVIVGAPLGLVLFFVYDEAFPDYGKKSFYRPQFFTRLVYNDTGRADGLAFGISTRF